MLIISRTALLASALVCVAAVAIARDDRGRVSFRTTLSGASEVPSVSTTGSGEFRLTIIDDMTLEYELTYRDLEGATTSASHVHLGQKSVNGGVMFFLCGGPRPPCTPTAGEFSGFVGPADIIGPAGQGVAPGEFAEVLRALRNGVTYANVHTDKHPTGEIRGDIRGGGN